MRLSSSSSSMLCRNHWAAAHPAMGEEKKRRSHLKQWDQAFAQERRR